MAKGFNRPAGGRKMQQGNMMAQLQKMQEQMAETQERLAEETVEETVGGGVVKVIMTGAQVCKSIEIAPELLEDTDAEMLQDMLLSAVNLALDKSRKLAEDRMSAVSGGLSGLGLGL